MLIYATSISPRLQYMAHFAGQLLTGNAFNITTEKETFQSWQGPSINYSDDSFHPPSYWIIPQGLLSDQGIKAITISCFESQGMTSFFKTGGDHPFDILAASFYLLSRYEEYLPYEKDMYGRYAHTNSLAYRQGFLQVPLINQWFQQLAIQLKNKFPELAFHKGTFSYTPSYDIDIAWSYRNKGFWRNTGGLLRSLFTGKWKEAVTRLAVWSGRQKDPFDSYGQLNRWHEQYQLRPYYFFPMADKKGKYDKNISPKGKALQALVYDHAIRYPVGLHPSWRSGDEPALLTSEKNNLFAITGNPITASRQHYIRFTLPGTFRQLLEAGIRFDFSMGYGSINGFRASVCTPYYWYDLEKEAQTELLLFPFCYMDANSFYEQHVTATEALQEMKHYRDEVKKVNGILITIWHNHFLGTDPLYAGWKEAYEGFLKEVGS